MNTRWIQSFLVASGLAIAIHLDWHAARHGERLSLGWSYHWVLAIPVFAVAAVHTVRAWRPHEAWASVGVLAAAVVLGQVVEPVLEMVLVGSSLSGAFSRDRLIALGAFVGVGAVAFTAVLWRMSRDDSRLRSQEPAA